MELLKISELINVLTIERGEIMKSDDTLKELAPILRPSDVVHNRVPERLSNEYDEPLPTKFVTARLGDVAVCLHFSPGSTCMITEEFDGSIPTKGIALCTISDNNQKVDPGYITAWLLSGILKTKLQRLQIGSHMATVKMSDLLQIRVPIPDLATQKKLCKAVSEARESATLIKELAHETSQLLKFQNELFIANTNEL